MRRVILFFATLGLLLCATPAFVSSSASAWSPFGTPCAVSTSTTKGTTACTTTGTDPLTGKGGILYKTARVLGIIAAIGAIIMIFVGGFMYITSGGDSAKATNARKVIISACGGLLVIALAEAIIAFAVNIVR
ncbi:MAG TPA: hypothetical protein VLF43_04765 [Candidatus Saccharimonadales bacterium]|nr:hypothetical protein [Candidatus Saccharimonadales bacterium]